MYISIFHVTYVYLMNCKKSHFIRNQNIIKRTLMIYLFIKRYNQIVSIYYVYYIQQLNKALYVMCKQSYFENEK